MPPQHILYAARRRAAHKRAQKYQPPDSAIMAETSTFCLLRHDDMQGNEAEVGRKLREETGGIEHVGAVELLFPARP